jgi:hypothetical protein
MLKTISILAFLLLTFAQVGCYSEETAVYNNEAGKGKEVNKAVEESDIYSYDFGQVKEGEILKHNFVFKNKSQNPLTIKKLDTSCGCTGSRAEKMILLPQEETLIEVQLNTKGYKGKTQQYIYVETDNLDNPLTKYIIEAEVVK